jgi:hypothetical protein
LFSTVAPWFSTQLLWRWAVDRTGAVILVPRHHQELLEIPDPCRMIMVSQV